MADESKGDAPAELTALSVAGPTMREGGGTTVTAAASGSLFLYGRGPGVVVRDAENPSMAFVHQPHSAPVTVAVMSPCGKYVASGDDTGNVKVWTYSNPVTMYKELDGIVADQVVGLSWNATSTRLAIVGDKSKGGSVVVELESSQLVANCRAATSGFAAVTYNRVGEERVAMVTVDGTISVFGGPADAELPWEDPVKVIKDVSARIYCAAYSPTSDLLVCGLANGGIVGYNGDGERVITLDGAHGASGIYAISFSADGSQFFTNSANKQCKLWNTESKECVATFTLGKTRERMQVGGVLTASGTGVTLSKDGSLAFLSMDTPDAEPVFYGTLKGVPTGMSTSPDGKVYATFADGIMVYTADGSGGVSSAVFSKLEGVTHFFAGATMFAAVQARKLVFGSMETGEITSTEEVGRVLAVSARQLGEVFVSAAITEIQGSTQAKIVMSANGELKAEQLLKYQPICIDVAVDGSRVVVGSSDKKKVHTFLLQDDQTLAKNKATDPNNAGITCVSVSPNGALIAYGDADKEIRVVDAETKKFKMLKGLWTNHNARITSVAWNASSNYVASTGMFDFRIRSWNMDTGKKCKVYKLASVPVATAWLDDNTLFSIDELGTARAVAKKAAK